MSLLNIKRLTLTVLFMFLTLSIWLVSVNSPLSVKAQNNAISQNGAGAAEQETKQGQSSTQDSQIVSGDGSILSGNNVLCQDQENSETVQALTGTCNVDDTNPPPQLSQNILRVKAGAWEYSSGGTITVSDGSGNSDTFGVGPLITKEKLYVVAVGDRYTISVDIGFSSDVVFFDGDCSADPRSNTCTGIMDNAVKTVGVALLER